MTNYGDGEIITITVVVIATAMILVNLMCLSIWACRPKVMPETTSCGTQTNTKCIINTNFANNTITEEAKIAPSETVLFISNI
jgi:hypothetical protein